MKRRRNIAITGHIFLFLLFLSSFAFGQNNQYIIRLTDKNNSPYSVAQPEEFLSQRAIERRSRQKIKVVENDLPVNPQYLNALSSIEGVRVINTSKWLNQVYVDIENGEALDEIMALPFVKGNQQMKRTLPQLIPDEFSSGIASFGLTQTVGAPGQTSYGFSESQIKIHHGDFLHNQGFRGAGMLISVIDGGFNNFLTLPAFDSLRLENRIVDTFDFVGGRGLNRESAHGMNCLSLMAANLPGTMVGTAPDASFLLYRSENVAVEYPGEEQNWVAAAERSDSAGADIISTSLGYNVFDNLAFNHSYEDMDGKTTLIAWGAAVAASKGMILVTSAGNEGNQPWHYMTTPADVGNTLAVGAVDTLGNPGAFSSYGPTADGRVKPDISSVGVGAHVQNANGSISKGNGTSFAAPNIAGLTACLWQAFSEFTSEEIMDVIRESSSLYPGHDDRIGFGIPDFKKAYDTLMTVRQRRKIAEQEAILADILDNRSFVIYPNPVNDGRVTFVIDPEYSGKGVFQWFDLRGRLCLIKEEQFMQGQIRSVNFNVAAMSKGVYIVRLSLGEKNYVGKVVIR